MSDKYEAWFRITTTLCTMKQRDLHKLKKMVLRELHERYGAREALKERVLGGLDAMANFMAGVTWALACRAALRASKGHTPVGGERPQSGEMWLPYELLYAVRHQVKERGWHPITTEDWTMFRAHMLGEMAPRRDPGGDFGAVQFAVRMAAPTYAAVNIDERSFRDITDF